MANNVWSDKLLNPESRKEAWFTLGGAKGERIRAGERLTATDALKRLGLDYTFHKLPLEVGLPGGGRAQVGKKVAVMRSPTEDEPEWAHVGIVDAGFTIVQNAELAAAIDPLSEVWPVVTAAAIDNGRMFLVVLDASAIDIKGDRIARYFLVSNGNSGDHALRIAVIFKRLACTNMLEGAIGGSPARVSLSHGSGVHRDMGYYSSLLAKLEVAQQETELAYRRLADTRVREEQVVAIIQAAYPLPKTPPKVLIGGRAGEKGVHLSPSERETYEQAKHLHELDVARTREFRDGALMLYRKMNDEQPATAGTLYNAVNAVSECSQVRVGRNPISTAESELFGERAQERQRAFGKAWKIAEGKDQGVPVAEDRELGANVAKRGKSWSTGLKLDERAPNDARSERERAEEALFDFIAH